jgi:tetratricopeptide (TPR) repeat protein
MKKNVLALISLACSLLLAQPLFATTKSPQELLESGATALKTAQHPADALYLHNVAEALQTQGYYKEAEPLYQQALLIWENSLGMGHPSVASALYSLAQLYQLQGRSSEAENHYRRAISMWETALGPDHPSVGFSIQGLAQFYAQQNRYDEAEAIFLRAINIVQGAFPAGLPFADGIRADYEALRQRRIQEEK